MGIVQSLFGASPPPLRPNGPAPFMQPSERDRQALFWWLTRNTSYTAIEHNARLWADFAAEFESWLRSQEPPPEEDITTYKYIVGDQLKYERGLKRLRLGDRSVFDRRSSEGWLGKINTGLVQRRMELYGQPEDYLEQFGIPASLIRSYCSAHNAAMAVAGWSGGYTGSQFWKIRTFASRISAVALSLPEPQWSISFKPGNRAPKDGIYEQVNAEGHIVGGLGYFTKGMESESDDWLEYGPHAGTSKTKAFLWRLLWEDTRYKDGTIPEEERYYPTPSESVSIAEAAEHQPRPTQSLRCEAGHPCPQEGYWLTPAKADSRRHFAVGELMPAFTTDYGQTIWQWDEDQTPR